MKFWNFFQYEILGMKWLDRLLGKILTFFNFDTEAKLTGALRFFIYDTVKILALLFFMIFIISYIQSFFPPERTKRILGRFKGIKANFLGALLGTVTPFCSCSSIPLFIGFVSSGLPLGVTFSFLISSPMVDLASLVLLMSIWGWKIAFLYVIFGLFIAVTGGLIIEKLNLQDEIEDFIKNAPQINAVRNEITLKSRIYNSYMKALMTAKKLFPYILLGVGAGSLIHNFIPSEFVQNLLGKNNPLGVILAVIVGIPMYADIFGTIPIAEALLNKGALLGVVLSFMMAVTTLSFPSILLLKKAVKPKLLAVFVSICAIGIILAGYLFNFLHFIII